MIRFAIGGAMLVLTCGQVLVWRRRDNVLGYVQVGTYLATFAIPLFGTAILDRYEPEVIDTYAAVLLLGAPAFLVGLAYGAFVGRRSRGRIALTAGSVGSDPGLGRVARRARLLAGLGVASLAMAYVLLGYAPLLEGDTQAAKYGIGPYAAGFARGRLVYLFGLTLGAAVLPVILALLQRQRRWIDVALAGGLGLGLGLSLNRGLTFLGPVTFLAAWAVQRRLRAGAIVAAVTSAYLAAIVFNQLTLPTTQGRPSFATMATISAPDLPDQLNFVRGFEARGRPYNAGSTILAGLDPGGGEDGSTYALRIATGIEDLGLLAAGGLRLPAPVWGYSAFGLAGAAAWPFLSGFFAGWGAAKLKRLVAPAMGQPHQALTLVLAVTVYNGTFGLLEQFYFTSTAGLVLLVVAVVVGLDVRVRLLGPGPEAIRDPGPVPTGPAHPGPGDGAGRPPDPASGGAPPAPLSRVRGPFVPLAPRPPSGEPPR